MRIYISGGITGVENYKEKFAEAEEKLKAEYPEADIVNPAKLSEIYQNGNCEDYIDICLYLLAKCDSIYMLQGWEDSKGASIEHTYARIKEMTIVEE